MISDDELRRRITQIEPLPTSIPVDPFASPRAQDILEAIMTTQIPDTREKNSDHLWRKPAFLTGVAAAVVAFGIVLVGVTFDGPGLPAKAKTTLALKMAGSSSGVQSSAACVVFSIPFLREMPLAFAGTVTSVSNSTVPTLSDMTVTLSVDHWYKGGSADVVTLTTMTSHALTPTTWVGVEDGTEFVQGKRYLVTATNGTVNGCTATEATPELEKAFAEAFSG